MDVIDASRVFAFERPDVRLLTYYVLTSLLAGPFFPFVLLPLYFRYHTMRYRFDEEGVTMRWGILFRREISLNYSRLQDIHLTSNVLERWLGLGRVQLQTASGSAKAEMTIEGMQEFELVRDFLYSRRRGARRERSGGAAAGAGSRPVATPELAGTLRDVAGEMAGIRAALESWLRHDGHPDGPGATGAGEP